MSDVRRGPAIPPSPLRGPVIAMLVSGVLAAAFGLASCGVQPQRLRRPVPVASRTWAGPAAQSASSCAASAAQAAALLDDPGPSVPSWPTTVGATWIARYRGKVVKGFSTADKVVALTFDDGPDASTRKIVGILDSYGAHATFFFRGDEISPGDIDLVVAHGNEVGNHTLSHVGLSGRSTPTMAREISTVDDQVFWAVGRRPLWVRARAGDIGPQGLAVVEARGQLYANWNVSADDTDWSLSAGRIAENVVPHVTPGSIVLLHQTRPDTVTALPAILSQLKAKGYRFLTLSELAEAGEP